MDGTADFRRLSDEELAQAKASADPALNPLDWENVRRELKRRKAKRRVKLLPIMTRVVGWYLLVGCAIGLTALFAVASTANALFVAITTVPLAIWGFGGALLLAKKRVGGWVGIAALLLQLPTIHLDNLAYHFRPFYGVMIGLFGPILRIQFDMGTEILFRQAGGKTTDLAIDLVAAYGIVILLWSMRSANRAS